MGNMSSAFFFSDMLDSTWFISIKSEGLTLTDMSLFRRRKHFQI